MLQKNVMVSFSVTKESDCATILPVHLINYHKNHMLEIPINIIFTTLLNSLLGKK
jgi:hypothetical protein